MIEIITEKVNLPEDTREWKYKKFISTNPNVWQVFDTETGEQFFEGIYENSALACHNLNKKQYKYISQNKDDQPE